MTSFKSCTNTVAFNAKNFIKWIVIGTVTGIIVGAIASAFAHCLSFAANYREENPNILFLLPIGGLIIVFLYKKCIMKTTKVRMMLLIIFIMM